ncbi:Coiled-coil-helix-coiled-coil-helix domain-containing 8 [Rhynchospora pubera]|uniref:Coiled-coil-helix-coiled-coil-helix domain-containing 8 n=1 Tax=Rhynchospora pubera TaxID=906938 RepID=A0AAV8DT77_9POAL|nr:Coiled-coil-helix-coiled-coil-helix domain-containing 8 [Rhynchospora pubera]
MGISSNSSGATEKTPSSPSPPPRPTHQDDADEEDESVKQLQECSALYLSLQECLIKSNRDWKSCQAEVQALKACNAKRNCSSNLKY